MPVYVFSCHDCGPVDRHGPMRWAIAQVEAHLRGEGCAPVVLVARRLPRVSAQLTDSCASSRDRRPVPAGNWPIP
jgi:hypothetical protein